MSREGETGRKSKLERDLVKWINTVWTLQNYLLNKLDWSEWGKHSPELVKWSVTWHKTPKGGDIERRKHKANCERMSLQRWLRANDMQSSRSGHYRTRVSLPAPATTLSLSLPIDFYKAAQHSRPARRFN